MFFPLYFLLVQGHCSADTRGQTHAHVLSHMALLHSEAGFRVPVQPSQGDHRVIGSVSQSQRHPGKIVFLQCFLTVLL